MNGVQKVTAAALALTITLSGATLATSPVTLADSRQMIARAHDWSASHLYRLAAVVRLALSSARV